MLESFLIHIIWSLYVMELLEAVNMIRNAAFVTAKSGPVVIRALVFSTFSEPTCVPPRTFGCSSQHCRTSHRWQTFWTLWAFWIAVKSQTSAWRWENECDDNWWAFPSSLSQSWGNYAHACWKPCYGPWGPCFSSAKRSRPSALIDQGTNQNHHKPSFLLLDCAAVQGHYPVRQVNSSNALVVLGN